MPKPGPTDTVPALLTPGEHVMNREAVALLGADNLAKANREGLKMRQQNVQGYQYGGEVKTSGIYRGGNSFSDKPSQFGTQVDLSSAPKISTPGSTFETPNVNNTAKQLMGGNGSQAAIGAAVKPVYQDPSDLVPTGSTGFNAPIKNNLLQGFSCGTTDSAGVKKGIFAGQDRLLRGKMVANSMPNQVGNIGFLENTDLQGFANGGEVEDNPVPHPISELQKPVTAGPVTDYAAEYKGMPLVPAVGKALSDFGDAYSKGAKEFGEHYASGAKGVYNALVTKPNAAFKNVLYGEGAQTPAEKLISNFSTGQKAPAGQAPLTEAEKTQPPKAETILPDTAAHGPIQRAAPLTANIPAEQTGGQTLMPNDSNYANLGNGNYIKSGNTAGIRRVNSMVAAGGLSNPEKEARFARDAANTAAQTAKYGDGKPTQPSELDKLQDIALNGGATGDMTPTQFGSAKRRSAAAKELLGIRAHALQAKQNYDLQNKTLVQNAEAAKNSAAYDRQKDEADRELKKQELAQKTNNTTKVLQVPIDPANPMLGTRSEVHTYNQNTGEEVVSPEIKKAQLEPIRQKYLALLNDPTKDAEYKQGLQQHMAQKYPELMTEDAQ